MDPANESTIPQLPLLVSQYSFFIAIADAAFVDGVYTRFLLPIIRVKVGNAAGEQVGQNVEW